MASFTPVNMSGKYMLNKQLSTNMEEMMQIQNVDRQVRKAITSAPVALTITHDVTSLNTLAEVTGAPAFANNRLLDGTSVEENNPIVGLTKKRAVVVVFGDVTEAHLKDAWKGLDPETNLVLTSYESVNDGWKMTEIGTGFKRSTPRFVWSSTASEQMIRERLFVAGWSMMESTSNDLRYFV